MSMGSNDNIGDLNNLVNTYAPVDVPQITSPSWYNRTSLLNVLELTIPFIDVFATNVPFSPLSVLS